MTSRSGSEHAGVSGRDRSPGRLWWWGGGIAVVGGLVMVVARLLVDLPVDDVSLVAFEAQLERGEFPDRFFEFLLAVIVRFLLRTESIVQVIVSGLVLIGIGVWAHVRWRDNVDVR